MEYAQDEMQAVQEGIIVADRDGCVEYVNDRVTRILSFTKKQLLKQPVTDIVYDRYFKDNWESIVESVCRGNRIVRDDIRLVSKNGAFARVSLTCTLMRNPAKDEDWIVFYIVDISKEIATTRELERRNRDLARENTKLMKESTNFKRMSELKTKFLGIASHELKTPLTSIKGYSELLLDNMQDEYSPKVQKMLERIQGAADKLHTVINDMLDVSRIEQNRLRLKPEELSIEEVLSESLQEVNHFISRRHMEVSIDVPDKIPLYYGDRMRLRQVFTNLISNAVKYSFDNTTIACLVEIRDGAFHIVVEDQGVGIDVHEREKIFTPFYEVSNAPDYTGNYVKEMGGGTGLGLSIVRGIVKRHGGEIWVEDGSRENAMGYRGSQFHIQLPIQTELEWDDDETRMFELQSIMNQPTGAKFPLNAPPDEHSGEDKTIVIIDDDAETIEVCRALFEERYTLLTSATGELGLRLAFEQTPDLILLNIYLPGLSGDRICRILKSQKETRTIPVAFFSAATQDNEVELAYDSGGDDFIIKPFNNKELLDKVAHLLRTTAHTKGPYE
jgi:PAS domain S-box-containing protein